MQIFPPLQLPLQGPIPILQHSNLWIKLYRGRNSAASFLLLGHGHRWHHVWPGGSRNHGSRTPWGKNRWRSCFYRKHWECNATNKPHRQVRMPQAPSTALQHLPKSVVIHLKQPILSFSNIWNWVFNWSARAVISHIGGRTEAEPQHNWITFPETTLSIVALKVTLRCTARTPGSVESPRHIAELLSPQQPHHSHRPGEEKRLLPFLPPLLNPSPKYWWTCYSSQRMTHLSTTTTIMIIIMRAANICQLRHSFSARSFIASPSSALSFTHWNWDASHLLVRKNGCWGSDNSSVETKCAAHTHWLERWNRSHKLFPSTKIKLNQWNMQTVLLFFSKRCQVEGKLLLPY